MKKVKYHKGSSDLFDVTLDSFRAETHEQSPYFINDNGEKKAYAFCPQCEQPVILLGIYKPINGGLSPHARHVGTDVPLGNTDQYKYLNCPYHKKKCNFVREVDSDFKSDERAENIAKLFIANFDRCIYLFKKYTGLVVSDKFAKKILDDYFSTPGYFIKGANVENIPWLMTLCISGKSLYKKCVVKDSPLYKMVNDIEDIRLDEIKNRGKYKDKLYQINPLKKFIDYNFIVSRVYTKVENNELVTYLTFNIGVPDGSGTYNNIAVKDIKVETYAFNRLCHSKKVTFRNESLLNMALEKANKINLKLD